MRVARGCSRVGTDVAPASRAFRCGEPPSAWAILATRRLRRTASASRARRRVQDQQTEQAGQTNARGLPAHRTGEPTCVVRPRIEPAVQRAWSARESEPANRRAWSAPESNRPSNARGLPAHRTGCPTCVVCQRIEPANRRAWSAPESEPASRRAWCASEPNRRQTWWMRAFMRCVAAPGKHCLGERPSADSAAASSAADLVPRGAFAPRARTRSRCGAGSPARSASTASRRAARAVGALTLPLCQCSPPHGRAAQRSREDRPTGERITAVQRGARQTVGMWHHPRAALVYAGNTSWK